jgi:hypothetical protein
VEEMRDLIKHGQAVSVHAAAVKVANKAFGSGTAESKRDRLAKRFRAKYGIHIAQIRSV